MRVLLVGGPYFYNVGWSIRRLLPELGHEVVVMDDSQYFGGWSPSLADRVFRRIAGVPPKFWRYNSDLVHLARTTKPDVLLAISGTWVSPSALERVRQDTGAKLVNYSLDDWFSLNPRAVIPNMHACIPLWDLMVTTKRYNVAELQAAGAHRVVFIRCGYDPLVHYPVTLSPQEKLQWESDVLFIGTYECDRAKNMETLVSLLPCKLRIYGNGWHVVPRRSPLRPCIQGRPLYGHEKRLAFAGTKIGLAFLRKANRDTYTDRSFEIPACRTFMLAERSEEHALLYEEGKEIACFGSVEELVDKVRYYLRHDLERQQIAEAGYQRVTHDRHTYRDRLLEILDEVAKL
jgi:glycosyltransferase involved in cell wall biosynthesis